MLKRLIDSPWLYFGLAALLAAYGIYASFDFSGPPRPKGTLEDITKLRDRDDLNVVFVLIDTLRSDRLSSYGYERETTPYMDHLASGGIRFQNVQAQSSWTKASMASLWTASYPRRAGVLRFGHGLPEEPALPSERFQEAGFLTAGFIRNGWVEANFGFGRGFDTYMMPFPVRTAKRAQVFNPSSPGAPANDQNLTDLAREFLSANASKRFFLYLHYMDLHQYTYDEASALFGSSFSDAYDNALHWTDRNVGGLIRELEELGIADRTLLVIASDHGEAFMEHGAEGHARDLHAEVVETPWIIGLPFELDEPVVVDERVANVDLWPTILDLMGLPELPNVDGRSALPLILAGDNGEAGEADRVIFSQLDKHWGKTEEEEWPLLGVSRGPYRLFYEPKEEDPKGLRLFDASSDPGETRNLTKEKPEIVVELRAAADEHLAEASEQGWSPPKVELDEMRKSQLRALGYLGDE